MNESIKKQAIDPVLKSVISGVTSFFEDLSKDYGFEEREGQKLLAYDITKAIITKRSLVGEAGVGIGKSFAYIVPLLFYNKATSYPVAIATSTIALQEQVVSDIKTISDMIDYHPEIVNTKGQNHFVCQNRAEKYFGENEKPSDILHSIREGAGERKDFTKRISNQIWNSINVNSYNGDSCGRCKYSSNCKYHSLRKRMLATYGIIVCNQDLLLANQNNELEYRKGMLAPDLSIIVIDEAHNLESKVRNSLTNSYSHESMMNTVRQYIISSDLLSLKSEWINDEIESLADAVKYGVELLYEVFTDQIVTQLRQHNGNSISTDRDKYMIEINQELKNIADHLYCRIIQLINKVGIYRKRFRLNHTAAYRNMDNRIGFLADFIYEYYGFEEDSDYLFWLEVKTGNVIASMCPKDIAAHSKKILFENLDPTILVSATLTNTTEGELKDQYRYLIENVGFPKDRKSMLSKPKQSPFPYDRHSMIYFASDLPHPTTYRDEFVERATRRLIELLIMSDGKALVLFTAKTDLAYVRKELKKNDLPFEILSQSDKGSQKEIIRKFKYDENSVLLATGSFWEGISIEGKPLSHLIIFRLPFPVPDPIIDYKCSVADNPLMEVQVPEMIIKLKQGVGRLIRNETDKGIVSILDPRLGNNFKNQYKELVWDALPMKNKTDSLAEIKAFYNTIVSDQDGN